VQLAFQQGTEVLLVSNSPALYHYALYLRRTFAASWWPFLIWIDAVLIHWTSYVQAYLHSAFSSLCVCVCVCGGGAIYYYAFISHKEACRDHLDESRVYKPRCLYILSPGLLNEFWLIMTYVCTKIYRIYLCLETVQYNGCFLWGLLRFHFRSAFLFNRVMASSCSVPLTSSFLEMRLLCVYRWRRSSKCCSRDDHMQMKAQKFPAFGFMPWRPHCYKSLCIKDCRAQAGGKSGYLRAG